MKNSTLYIGLTVIILVIIGTFNRKKIMDAIWDLVSQSRIDKLHPAIRQQAINFIHAAQQEGIFLRVTAGLRTYAEQDALYAKGRTAPGSIVTNARGGYSYHNFGLALDVVEIKNGEALWNNPNWSRIAAIGKRYGFSWGGDWTSFIDKPHFEMSYNTSLAELRNKYANHQLTDGYVNLV